MDFVESHKVQNNFALYGFLFLSLLKDFLPIIVLYMEYNCYEEAYAALVKDNDGVLPDLYEITDITISSHLCNLSKKLTVADIVAYALVEVSKFKFIMPSRLPAITEPLYLPTPTGEPLHLDKLLDQAVASLN